jgi:hypothetical protein
VGTKKNLSSLYDKRHPKLRHRKKKVPSKTETKTNSDVTLDSGPDKEFDELLQ